MSAKIRVLIADDHDVVVRGLEAILRDLPDIAVLAPAVTGGPQLESRLRETPVDVLLLDCRMPEFDMLTALPRLLPDYLRLKVIVVTAMQDEQLVREAARRGVHGFVLKDEPLASLLPLAIRDVQAGRTWFSPRAGTALIRPRCDEPPLTEYQREVLRLMVEDQPVSEIASQLGRRPAAIHSIQRELRNRLHVLGNEGLVATAIQQRLVPLLNT